ncbi:MAG: hypothetical protein NXY57DRAFT_970578 [Lentinula lateritia]|nr:MAG: hypothetical protein NXY57DRAFT_970578 [Lentinula lateritia]
MPLPSYMYDQSTECSAAWSPDSLLALIATSQLQNLILIVYYAFMTTKRFYGQLPNSSPA